MRIDETPGTATAKEQKLKGIGVSPGIAIGPAYIGDRGELPVSESRLAESDVEGERARFAEAIATSTKQLRKLRSRDGASRLGVRRDRLCPRRASRDAQQF